MTTKIQWINRADELAGKVDELIFERGILQLQVDQYEEFLQADGVMDLFLEWERPAKESERGKPAPF